VNDIHVETDADIKEYENAGFVVLDLGVELECNIRRK